MIAMHKYYRVPDDPLYLPVHVGAEGKPDLCSADGCRIPGCRRDDTGENISALNPSFCELTCLYWGWKNIDTDYIGLVHYRRYFGRKRASDPFEGILTEREFLDMIPLGKNGERVRLFVPKKRHYYIETLYSHYAHTHYASHLDKTRKIVGMQCPEYLMYYDRTLRQRSGHMFNMMIMDKQLLDDYCNWLFGILKELKRRLDTGNTYVETASIQVPAGSRKNTESIVKNDGDAAFSAFQGRFYGRVSEILLNVWLNRQIETGVLRREEIMELPWISMERTNWFRKGGAFLRAKFFRKKYRTSF